QAPYLEPAGIGEDRPAPAHETMEAPVRADHVDAGPQPQMKRITEYDLRAHLLELAWRHRLDGAVRAHRHEHRRIDNAVRELEPAAARAPGGRLQRELHCADSSAGSSSIPSP